MKEEAAQPSLFFMTEKLKVLISNLKHSPGVYLMYDKNKKYTIQLEYDRATDTVTYHGYPDWNNSQYGLSITKYCTGRVEHV